MNSKVEKRRAFLIDFAFVAVLLALIYVFFKYLFWIAAPFLLSFFFAVLLLLHLKGWDSCCPAPFLLTYLSLIFSDTHTHPRILLSQKKE